jgi:hypothetical protein
VAAKAPHSKTWRQINGISQLPQLIVFGSNGSIESSACGQTAPLDQFITHKFG